MQRHFCSLSFDFVSTVPIFFPRVIPLVMKPFSNLIVGICYFRGTPRMLSAFHFTYFRSSYRCLHLRCLRKWSAPTMILSCIEEIFSKLHSTLNINLSRRTLFLNTYIWLFCVENFQIIIKSLKFAGFSFKFKLLF